MAIKVEIDLPRADKVARRCGLDEGGAVQMFHTLNVLRRMEKYMWKVSGASIKQMGIATDISKSEIVMPGSASQFLRAGKLMLGDETESPFAKKYEKKHVVNQNLNFNKEKNTEAGPYPDKRLAEKEGDLMVQELQNYIEMLRRQK